MGARAIAKDQGLRRYFTGNACPAGHVDERYVGTGRCIKCTFIDAASWKNENRERTREYARARYWSDPDAFRQRNKAFYAADPVRSKTALAVWHKKNPTGRVVHEANRRARLKNAGGQHSRADIETLKARQRMRCAECLSSIKKHFHVDHRMPIALGGSNYAKNLQLLCQPCNQRKHAKHPIIFARENGRLL